MDHPIITVLKARQRDAITDDEDIDEFGWLRGKEMVLVERKERRRKTTGRSHQRKEPKLKVLDRQSPPPCTLQSIRDVIDQTRKEENVTLPRRSLSLFLQVLEETVERLPPHLRDWSDRASTFLEEVREESHGQESPAAEGTRQPESDMGMEDILEAAEERSEEPTGPRTRSKGPVQEFPRVMERPLESVRGRIRR